MLAKIIKMEDIKGLERFADYEVGEYYLNCVTHKITNILKDQQSRIEKLEQNEPYPNKKELERMNTYEGSD